ncbi:MAG: TIGR03960 family B12-binding radical SAM protein [Christensenellaceae bacterium]|jgi:radical SAM family uncharacterized protein
MRNSLKYVEKPARYVGGELNSVIKEKADIHFALAFADVYEVGMSHLGIQILYEVLNAMDGVYAERVFCPWVDMIAEMEKRGEPLRSLETGGALHAFDIVGINMSYEMSYSNVLKMLSLGNIPLLAQERSNDIPVVLGGGACTVNPEPVADFFDAFCIGEGEECVVEFCTLYGKHKKSGFDRKKFLKEAAHIEGIYVPSLYEVFYNGDGTVGQIAAKEGAPEKVKKRFVRDFDAAQTITRPVLPFIGTVHDRCVLEIMRGCTNGCRFCQAGYAMRPVRERSKEKVVEQAKRIIAATGYDEISLSSLSSGDYSEIRPLIGELIQTFEAGRVSVSMPSMRLNTFDFAGELQKVRKTGLTFAPEAGTQRLRDVINKNITEEDIMRSVTQAFLSGATSVKLYFMIGLPTETYEDLDGIATLVKQIKDAFYAIDKSERGRHLNITVSAACFVPKPCTPFMWEAQDSLEVFRDKQQYLRDRLKIKGVKFNYHDARVSFLEAVFARGDRKLAAVLLAAHKNGAVFDAWDEHFSFERYMEAFDACKTDPAFYANRQRPEGEVMPFSHIDMRISEEYLLRERGRAYGEKTTPACKTVCAGCGLMKECDLFEQQGSSAENS